MIAVKRVIFNPSGSELGLLGTNPLNRSRIICPTKCTKSYDLCMTVRTYGAILQRNYKKNALPYLKTSTLLIINLTIDFLKNSTI